MKRRNFLYQAGCGAMSLSTFYSSVLNLNAVSRLAADSMNDPEYKALVCILLAGGNDSYNMLMPKTGTAYNEYSQSRTNLALASNSILGINPMGMSNGSFGVHPAMPEVQSLFNTGKLSFVNNVGTLLAPTTKNTYENGSSVLPVGLYSHNDQIHQWQTSLPGGTSTTGWGGRTADILQSLNSSDISMNISVSGRNIFQVGNQTSEYTITNYGNGSVGIKNYGSNGLVDQLKTEAVKSLMEHNYQDMFKKTYADVIKGGQANHEEFSSILSNNQVNTSFTGNSFSQSLKMIARTIKSHQSLNMKRQVFFVTIGGWDHHGELLTSHQRLLSILSKGLGEFITAIEEVGMANQVTTFTISDFARTLASNGNGTDHAWGGNAMVMGGAVKGQRFFGEYPALALNGNRVVEENVVVPSMSTDEYFAELALWFGVSKGQLKDVLPNIGNFYNTSSSDAPVGFLL